MNEQQLKMLEVIKNNLKINRIKTKDLIRWCKDSKSNKDDIGIFMKVFTLEYDQVVFVMDNIDEIIREENKEVIIWTGFKYTMEKGQTMNELIELYKDSEVSSYDIEYVKITDLEGKSFVIKDIKNLIY